MQHTTDLFSMAIGMPLHIGVAYLLDGPQALQGSLADLQKCAYIVVVDPHLIVEQGVALTLLLPLSEMTVSSRGHRFFKRQIPSRTKSEMFAE